MNHRQNRTSSTKSLFFSRRKALCLAGVAIVFARSTVCSSAGRQVIYDVPLIPQQTAMSCWAAAIAMIISWARREEITPLKVATDSNRILEYQKGLPPFDAELFDYWGMVTEAPQTFTAEGFMGLLDEFGPIWVAAKTFAPHVRVATGFEFGTTPYTGPVHINDPLERGVRYFRLPNRGSSYTESYTDFAIENEALGSEELEDPALSSNSLYPVYFAHLKHKP